MARVSCVAVLVLSLAVAAVARGRRPRPKPKNASFLPKSKLWYHVHVPKPDPERPRETFPLLMVQAYRDDAASQAFGVWKKFAEKDRIFLASLNFPSGEKNRERRMCELVEELCNRYSQIDRRRLVYLGSETGGSEVIKFVAAHPRAFAVAIAVAPKHVPQLAKVKPNRKPSFARSATKLYVTYDPGVDKDALKKLTAVRKQLSRSRVSMSRPRKVKTEGQGKPSKDERELLSKLIRSVYPTAKRTVVLAMARKASDPKKPDGPTKPTTKQPGKPGPKPGPKPPVEKGDPDEVLLKAQEAYDNEEYLEALELFKKLARVRPDSEYSRRAEQVIKEIESDPAIQRDMVNKAAAKQGGPWLRVARNFRRNKLKGKAAEYYRKVIAKYPKSSFAAEARKELEEMAQE